MPYRVQAHYLLRSKQLYDLRSRRESVLAIASPADVVAALSSELFLAERRVQIWSKLSGKTVDAKELFIIMLETGLITDVNDPVTGRPFMIDGHFANRYSERDLVRKYGTDSDMVRFIQDDHRLNSRNPVVLGGVGDPGFDARRGAAKQWADRNVSRILFYPSELLGAAANTAAGSAYLINVEVALRDEMMAKAKSEGRKWSREDEDALGQAMITWRQGVGDVVGIVQAAGIGISKFAARRAMKKAVAQTVQETGDTEFYIWAKNLEADNLMIKEAHGNTISLFTKLPQPTGHGKFGPIFNQFRGRPLHAEQALRLHKSGEVPGALSHKDIGPIDLIWGEAPGIGKEGFGLAKIVHKHPEVLGKIQNLLDALTIKRSSPNRIILESSKFKAVIRLEFDGNSKR